MRLLVDRSIIELYATDGTRTIIDRFFPAKGPLRWSTASRGGPAVLKSMDAAAIR